MSAVPGSTADRPDWTAAEEAEVRTLLERVQHDLVVGPAPWPELARLRRRTRARRAGALVAVAAATALVGGVAGGVVPGLDRLGGTAYRAEVAGLARDGRTVGSLAGDTAFVAALRDRALSELTNQGDGTGAVVTAVPLATDLPGGRMALVEFRLANGADQAYWLSGAEAAPASRMYLHDSCDLAEPCWTRYGDGPDSVPDRKPDGTVLQPTVRGQGVILAGPGQAVVTVQTGNDVTTDGRVRSDTTTAAELWPGIYVAPLPTLGTRQDVTVRVTGAEPWRSWFGGGISLDIDAWWTAASAGGTAPAVTGTVERGDLMAAAQRVAGMTARPGDRVLYQSSEAGDDRAVLAFRGRSGGWALVSVHRTPTSANAFVLGVDGARAVPGGDPSDRAAGLDRLCLAWRTPDRGSGRQLQVLGPASARHALLVVPGQGAESGTVDLDGGFGSAADVPLVSQVVLLDGDRHEITGCEVSAPRAEGDLLR